MSTETKSAEMKKKEEAKDKDAKDRSSGRLSGIGAKKKARVRNKREGKQPKQLTMDQKRLYPDVEKSIPTITPGGYVSTLLASVTGRINIVTTIERNMYLVNVRAIIILLQDVEEFTRAMYRRPAWKNQWYYVGLWLRRFAARLQRVSISTDQDMFNANELISLKGPVPLLLSFIFSQFGIVEDKMTDSVVYPCVTRELIMFMAHVGKQLMLNTHDNIADFQDIDNYASWCVQCYGEDCAENVIAGTVFNGLGTGFGTSTSSDIRRNNFAASVNLVRRGDGAAKLSGAQWTVLSNDNANILFDVLAPGAWATIATGHGWTARMRDWCDENLPGVHATTVDLFANIPMPAQLSSLRKHPKQMVIEAEDMEIKARYITSVVSASPEGGWSPFIQCYDQEVNVFARCSVKGVTMHDYVIGVLMDHHVASVNRELVPWGMRHKDQEIGKYLLPPIGFSREELLAKAIRECVIRRKG